MSTNVYMYTMINAKKDVGWAVESKTNDVCTHTHKNMYPYAQVSGHLPVNRTMTP